MLHRGEAIVIQNIDLSQKSFVTLQRADYLILNQQNPDWKFRKHTVVVSISRGWSSSALSSNK